VHQVGNQYAVNSALFRMGSSITVIPNLKYAYLQRYEPGLLEVREKI